ncbi:MAG: PQQ-binding-like beta-propeller repeat protein [Candidatus Hydrogenedentes bacterium]|nr:PQQ-binding-like beta-propeller repeat protein [Candidatus Hydrogenedentota bacterium]
MRFFFTTMLSLGVFSLSAVAAPLQDWPEFRGPTAQGIAEGATPPVEWSAEKNIAWKRAIPGIGWSSPVVYQGGVYLMTALLDGEEKPTSLRALRVGGETGEIVWDVEVFPWSGPVQKQPKNSFASPTPIVAEGKVYVHFGPMGTACLDTEGKVLWKQTELAYDTPHGNGGSPALSGGKLIYSCDDTQNPFVVALDQNTGKVLWKTQRTTDASKKFSFSTPLVIDEGGRKRAVMPGSGFVGAYDLEDGAEVWRVNYGEGFSVVPRPVLSHGLVFVATGFINPCSVLAIRVGGEGDVTESHLAWRMDEGAPHTPSMLPLGDELYFVSDRGEMSCVDVATGTLHWREDIGGRYSASLVMGGGRIYVTSEEGTTHVVQAGKTFRKIAENVLPEKTYASLALSGPAIFLRTEGNLYRIEER